MTRCMHFTLTKFYSNTLQTQCSTHTHFKTYIACNSTCMCLKCLKSTHNSTSKKSRRTVKVTTNQMTLFCRFAFRNVTIRCVAVRYSALNCCAVRCSALQCVAVRCSALQCVAVRCSALQDVAVRCRMLQRISPSSSEYGSGTPRRSGMWIGAYPYRMCAFGAHLALLSCRCR